MCGRVIVDWEENMAVADDTALAGWMKSAPEGAASSWNVRPTDPIPVALTSTKNSARRLELARWSLTPSWSKELKTKYPMFNARAERIAEKASFSGALKAQRCVIPVTGFYEWSGPKGSRAPHAVFGPEAILPLAGLYSWWREPGSEPGTGWHLTATIITRASSGVMADIHDRMPLFVDDEIVGDWLDPRVIGDQALVDAASELAVPYSEGLREYRVAPLRGDGPELILPAR